MSLVIAVIWLDNTKFINLEPDVGNFKKFLAVKIILQSEKGANQLLFLLFIKAYIRTTVK